MVNIISLLNTSLLAVVTVEKGQLLQISNRKHPDWKHPKLAIFCARPREREALQQLIKTTQTIISENYYGCLTGNVNMGFHSKHKQR